MDKTLSNNENLLCDVLVNKILIVSAVLAITAFGSAQLRAFDIGWTYRDIIQFFVVGIIVILAIVRQKLNTHHKGLFLIIMYSIGGISGVFTLGMLGGTIFIFPAATVIMAVFYSKRATLIYIALSLLFCCFTAIRFCSGTVKLTMNADLLTTNYLHWFVYITCIAFFFAITFVTIHNYRKTMKILIDKINLQRDELTKSNEELLNASKNIKILGGLLPICSSCKKIRDDKGYWNQIEQYIKEHSEARFTHGICPNCSKTLYPEL